jgi:RNA polymerase sigma factor (sigma-70 family)
MGLQETPKMPHTALGEVLRFIHHACTREGDCAHSDRQLLEQFIAQRDENAFTVLLRRHGPMVFGVCRRLLDGFDDAEDAFQATFLVLVRRARSIRNLESVGSWLYGVAQRIALKARAKNATRRHREKGAANMPATRGLRDVACLELRAALDEEVGSLPEKYRAPVVLCYLEGKTQAQAARELGCPKTSLSSRLSHACTLLRRRLSRRGIALPAGALATAFAGMATAAPLPALLTVKTVKAALLMSAGKLAGAGCVSAAAVALADDALAGMFGLKGKLALVVLALGLAIGSAGLAGHSGVAGTSSSPQGTKAPPAAAEDQAASAPEKNRRPANDRYGDPLPDGAIARLGTIRFRHGNIATKVAFALGGNVVVSAGGDILDGFDVRLWNAATGQLLRRLPNSDSGLAISPDGKWLLTQDRRLFDVATGKELRRFTGPKGQNECVAFSPDGRLVAAGNTGDSRIPGQVLLWDAGTGKLLHQLDGFGQRVSSLAFSADGGIIAAASPENALQLWNAETGKKWLRIGTEKPGLRAYQNNPIIAFAPAGKLLASGRHNGRVIVLWDPHTGKMLKELAGDGDIAFSPDGKHLASGGEDGMIRLWDVATGQEVRRWRACQRNLTSIAFAPAGNMIASVGMQDHALRFWDAGTGKEVRPSAGHTGAVRSLRFTASGYRLLSSAVDGSILEWDVPSARETGRFFKGRQIPDNAWDAHDLASDGVSMVIAEAERDPNNPNSAINVRVWDMSAPKAVCDVKGLEMLRSLRLSADGKRVAMDSKDGIHVCDAQTGKRLFLIPGGRPHSGALMFSADARLLAWAGDRDGTIHLWDMAMAKEIRRWPTGQRKTSVVAFSPDGRLLAGADREDLRIWNVAAGKEQVRLRGQSWIVSLAFSASSRVLAAGEEQAGRIQLWEVSTGQKIRQIDGPQGALTCLAFAPGGRTLASGGSDTTIVLWNLAGTAKTAAPPDATAPAATPAALDRLWSDLGTDAAKAYAGIWALARAPKQSVSLLKDKLRPVAPADAKQVAGLIADLDSEQFAVRQKAAMSLDELGEAAESSVRSALDGKVTLEVRQRLQKYLEKRESDMIRKVRAVEVLEFMGTAEARALLQALTRESPNPQVGEAAAASVSRLTGK